MLSVNTNTGALVALQYLNKTNAALATTQAAINSGLKVASAKDDGSTFAIAQDMRGDVAGYSAVTDSLNRGISSVDVAMSAGQSISDLLIQMKQKAIAASDASMDTASRAALNEDFTALRDQISTIVSNAVFNGFDLIDGSTSQITALASADGTKKITVKAVDGSLDHQPDWCFYDDLDDRNLSEQRRQRSGASVFWCEEVLDPGRLRPEIVRYAAGRYRQLGRRRYGHRERDAAVLAGQAAA